MTDSKAIVRREMEIQRLRGLLARLEWAADRRWARAAKFCPVCRADGHQGRHEPGCEWVAVMRRDPPDSPRPARSDRSP